MKKSILISLLIGMMGMIAFVGCEKPEPIFPTEGQPQQRTEKLIKQQGEECQDTAVNPASFLIGKWAVNASMSECVYNNYTDTLVFATNGIIEKHSLLSGYSYSILNDTIIRIEGPNGGYYKKFTYYPPNGIMFYNFWDNTCLNVVKNVYYERIK
jgi:hypothetical protein